MKRKQKDWLELTIAVVVIVATFGVLAIEGCGTAHGQTPPAQQQPAYVLVPRYPLLRSLCGLPPAYDARPLYVLRYEPRTIYIPTYQPYRVPSR